MLSYFNGVLQTTLDEYLNLISTKHGIEFSELKELMNQVKITAAQPVPVLVAQPPPPPKIHRPVVVDVNNKCGYVLLRGNNAGNACGKKNKKDSNFCSLHSKKKEDNIVVVVDTTNVPVPKKPNPVLRMNKIIDKWWHPDTGLVFKSGDEKIVIGIFKDEQIADLSDADVATCIANKFKYVTKRKRNDDDDHVEEITKKQKVDTIDKEFIKVNQSAKNVEVLIKEMFTGKPNNYHEDDDSSEEQDDPVPGWDDGGVEESKENFHIDDNEDNDDDEDIVEDDDELLLEEDDS